MSAGRVCAQWTLTKLDVSFPRGWKSRFEIFSAICRCLPTTSGLNITKVLSLIVNTSGPLGASCNMVSAFKQHHRCGDALHLFVRNQNE